MMNGTKRTAIIFGIVCICLLLFACCFVVVNLAHDCVGENCITCSLIEFAQRTLDAVAVMATVYILFVASKFNFYNFLHFIKKYLFSNPISLKVKLSN